jgi:hypothetical protein
MRLTMKLPGNCLLAAAVAAVCGQRFRAGRNAAGRLHFYWLDRNGRAREFYKQGASRKTYLQNAFYFGEVRRNPKLDV